MKLTNTKSLPRLESGDVMLPRTEIRMAPPEWSDPKGVKLSPEDIREKRRRYEDRLAKIRYHQAKLYRLARNTITGGKRLVTVIGRKPLLLGKVNKVAVTVLLILLTIIVSTIIIALGALIAAIRDTGSKPQDTSTIVPLKNLIMPREDPAKK
jgi:hypothetical protein